MALSLIRIIRSIPIPDESSNQIVSDVQLSNMADIFMPFPDIHVAVVLIFLIQGGVNAHFH